MGVENWEAGGRRPPQTTSNWKGRRPNPAWLGSRVEKETHGRQVSGKNQRAWQSTPPPPSPLSQPGPTVCPVLSPSIFQLPLPGCHAQNKAWACSRTSGKAGGRCSHAEHQNELNGHHAHMVWKYTVSVCLKKKLGEGHPIGEWFGLGAAGLACWVWLLGSKAGGRCLSGVW